MRWSHSFIVRVVRNNIFEDIKACSTSVTCVIYRYYLVSASSAGAVGKNYVRQIMLKLFPCSNSGCRGIQESSKREWKIAGMVHAGCTDIQDYKIIIMEPFFFFR